MEPATNQEVRRAAETQSANKFTPQQKEKVAHYLVHTTQVANNHYRMVHFEQTAQTAELMMLLHE